MQGYRCRGRLAQAMPLVAWFFQTDAFGPDNSVISGRYPALLVAAGDAFSVWGLISLIDMAVRPLRSRPL